jgi:hypothetical protein
MSGSGVTLDSNDLVPWAANAVEIAHGGLIAQVAAEFSLHSPFPQETGICREDRELAVFV